MIFGEFIELSVHFTLLFIVMKIKKWLNQDGRLLIIFRNRLGLNLSVFMINGYEISLK